MNIHYINYKNHTINTHSQKWFHRSVVTVSASNWMDGPWFESELRFGVKTTVFTNKKSRHLNVLSNPKCEKKFLPTFFQESETDTIPILIIYA